MHAKNRGTVNQPAYRSAESLEPDILATYNCLRNQFVSRLIIRQLHAHLSGSISRQCLHDIWLQKTSINGGDEPALQDPLIEMPEDKYDYDLETFFPLFSRYIYALCNDASSIIYSTNSVLQSFQDDGVVYLELRTTPRAIPSAGITKDHYVQLVLSCISSFKSSTMTTKLILSIDRSNSAKEAMDVVSLALEYRSQGVVAVDLCGNPAKGDISIFRKAFKRAKDQGLRITLHFAEAPQSSTDRELRTLLSYEPDRIGHVINVPDEIREIIIARKIGLELCLSCNVHAKLITGSFGDHHFGYWRGKGCPVVLCVSPCFYSVGGR
jgi:adenosine deaminase